MNSMKESRHIFIDQLKSMSNSEFGNKFDETLLHILSSINSWDISYLCEAFDLFLRLCFTSAPFEQLEEKLFKSVFSKLKDVIINIYKDLEDCGNKVSYYPDKANKKLIHTAGLIRCISNILEYVNKNETCSYKSVGSVPAATAFILCFTYKHCKSSESIYGTNINDVYDALSSLFSTSQILQNNLLKLITLQIHYKLHLKEELHSFVEVFTLLVECGEDLISLDIRSTASQWKTISELAEKHKEAFLRFMITEEKYIMNKPIAILCAEMNKSLFKIIELKTSEYSQAGRIVKLNNFFMKILMKLCDLYQGYISDSVSNVLSLLYTIYGMSQPILKHRGAVSNEISDLIQTHVYVGAQVLVGNLIKDESFINNFLNEGPIANNLSYLLLCASIVKRLISSPKEVRLLWMHSKSNNLIWSIFNIISKSYYEISLSIEYPGVALAGQAPNECGLYELLLTHIGGFTLSADALEFELIEDVLLHIITNVSHKQFNNILTMTMASDLICLIDRYGTAELCFHHVTFFTEILVSVPCLNLFTYTELIFIQQILSRIFCFLPRSYKDRFLEEYDLKKNLAIYIAIELKHTESVGTDEFMQIVHDCEMLIPEFLKTGTVAKFIEMSDLLMLVSTADIQENAKFPDLFEGIISLWQCTNPTNQLMNRLSWENNANSSNKFLTKFIMILTKVTSKFILNFNNSQMLVILTQISDFIHRCNTSVKLQICSILNALSVKNLEFDTHTSMCLKHIIDLFKSLLIDDNAIIEQEALQAFAHFSSCTTHEEVIANVIGADHNLQNKLQEFLQFKPCVKMNVTDLDSYLTLLAKDSFKDDEELISSGQTVDFDHEEIPDIFQEFDEVPAKVAKLESDIELRNILDDVHNKIDLLILKSEGGFINDELREIAISVAEKLNFLLKPEI